MTCSETLIWGGAMLSILYSLAYLGRTIYKEWHKPQVLKDIETKRDAEYHKHLTGKSSWEV